MKLGDEVRALLKLNDFLEFEAESECTYCENREKVSILNFTDSFVISRASDSTTS